MLLLLLSEASGSVGGSTGSSGSGGSTGVTYYGGGRGGGSSSNERNSMHAQFALLACSFLRSLYLTGRSIPIQASVISGGSNGMSGSSGMGGLGGLGGMGGLGGLGGLGGIGGLLGRKKREVTPDASSIANLQTAIESMMQQMQVRDRSTRNFQSAHVVAPDVPAEKQAEPAALTSCPNADAGKRPVFGK